MSEEVGRLSGAGAFIWVGEVITTADEAGGGGAGVVG